MQFVHSRLSIGARLGLLAALFLAPIALLMGLFVTQSQEDVAFARSELGGTTYLTAVWSELVAAEEGGGANHARLSAAQAAFPARAQVQGAFTALRDAATPDDRVAAAAQLMVSVADQSNLTLDPDLDSFYAMDAVTVRLPALMLASERLRAAIVAPTEGETRAAALSSALDRFDGASGAVITSLNSAMDHNTSGQTRRVLAAETRALKATLARINAHGPALLAGAGGADDTLAALAAVDSLAPRLWTKTNAELARLLQARINGLNGKLLLDGAIVLVLLAASGLLAFLIARGMSERISRIVSAMERLARGDLDAQTPYLSDTNETGRIAAAVEVFKAAAVEKRRLEFHARQTEEAARAERARMAEQMASRFEADV